MWPERAQLAIIPGEIPGTIPSTKKACKLYVTLNPNNDAQQEGVKSQVIILLSGHNTTHHIFSTLADKILDSLR